MEGLMDSWSALILIKRDSMDESVLPSVCLYLSIKVWFLIIPVLNNYNRFNIFSKGGKAGKEP